MDAARHLLRRAGWAATPTAAQRAHDRGLARTLDELFPKEPPPFPEPESIAHLRRDYPAMARRQREGTEEERREASRELREQSQRAVQDLSLDWLQAAIDPERSAYEKWSLFLSDVYVISAEKVRRADFVCEHHEIIRRLGAGPAPALTKAISRSPAMLLYLDLQNSRPEAPNENFARELFELFVLGEGNYTEEDIKEAARAFTGYRQNNGRFVLQQRQHDAGPKRVFGVEGSFNGDQVIDLAYQQPAAATFLPRELIRFYLSEYPLDETYVAGLGDWWRAADFDLRALAHRFFGSRLFFDGGWRGTRIKSPVEFYLGLAVDLDLDVAPLPRTVLSSLRQMGQELYQPPNVRGWVGGRRWINASTLSARRQLVQYLLRPIDTARLNADEVAALDAAKAAGREAFTVGPERLAQMNQMSDEQIADRFANYFTPLPATPPTRDIITRHLAAAQSPTDRTERVRAVLTALLQSPAYQLS